MPETLTIIDNRTGRQYELPIVDGAIRAMDLRQIKVGPEDFGLLSYDPAFLNTAACRSRITFIDGERGVLLYRGYPIEQLAEHSTFLETAYLILFGELPTREALDRWTRQITLHTMLHENIKKFMEGFQYDAHPMGIFLSTVGALSTFYPDAKQIFDPEKRRLQTLRLIAKVPSIAAYAYRHSMGLPYVYPDNDLSYTGNFLNMLFKMTELKYQPHPVLERALDVLFILHADHEQNCSTHAMRGIGSSHVDPYSALAGAAAALYGPLHGGANEAVLRMLQEIGSVRQVPAFIRKVKAGEGRLMGFGHRVYKSYDPRAKIIKRIADLVFDVTGRNPLLDIALELERIALEDDYFVTRRLYPNVDFYSGLIYQAMGFSPDMFPVLFAIPRTAGGMAQWTDLHRPRTARLRALRAPDRGGDPVTPRAAGTARPPRRRPAGLLVVAALAAGVCAGAASAFDGRRAFEDLRRLVALGPRPAGSAALEDARRYLERQLAAAGVACRRQTFEARTPIGPIRMVNLIATIPGERPDRIAIAGHYDTKRFENIRFVGANDGASSAAFVLEMARVLRARRNRFTMELLFFDGEEATVEWTGTDHTYGSRYYVEAGRRDGTLGGLRALVLVDMIGDRNLVIRREGYSTPWLTDLIWASARRLGHAAVFVDDQTFIEDDHLPFLQAGIPAVDLIDLEYPPWHTSADTVDKTSPRSLQIVGDVLLDALPAIEARLAGAP
jgi:citrate synthase